MAEVSQIGPYSIISKIASGGMGTVYHARHDHMHRDVALKVMHPSFGDDSDFVMRFQREVQATAALRHPNIIEVYDANNADGFHYLAMEYITNGSLQNMLAELRETHKQMPIEESLKIVRQIAMALDYAHSKGFVHRDIKPSNIMIAAQDRYILTDFGIVQQEGAAKLTKTVAAIGTPEYMSPEQAQGQHVDGRSDIYSLGVVLYELIAGAPPFTGDTSWAVIFRHVKEPPPALAKLRPEVTPATRTIVEKALAKSPGARYQTAAEFASAIDGVLKVRKEKPSRMPLAIAAVATVTVLAAGAIVISVIAAQPAEVPLVATVALTSTKVIALNPSATAANATVAVAASPSAAPLPSATPLAPEATSVEATTVVTAKANQPTATLAPLDTPTTEPTATPVPSPTSVPAATVVAAATKVPVASATPAAPSMAFAAPALSGPASGSSFVAPAVPHLTWATVGTLGADDYYYVEVDHAKGVDPTYTKDTAMDAKDYLLGLQRSGGFTWRVSVVRKTASGYTTISPSSGNWSFNWTQSGGSSGGGGGQPRSTPIPP